MINTIGASAMSSKSFHKHLYSYSLLQKRLKINQIPEICILTPILVEDPEKKSLKKSIADRWKEKNS